MGRRKRDNSEEIIKAVAVLVFFGLLFLTGNPQAAVQLFLPVVIILAVGALLFAGLFLGIKWVSSSAPRSSGGEDEPSASFWAGCTDGHAKVLSTVPVIFTLDLIKTLEWRRFEIVVESLFRAEGTVVNRTRAGADGGVDLELRAIAVGPVTAIVQCKAWKTYSVGVKPVRELFGVMAASGVPSGHFVTSGTFTDEARAFARSKPLELIDGPELVNRLNGLGESVRSALIVEATAGDYTTPTCPSCETKMVRRKSQYGEFWGCRSYPRCRQTFR